MKRWDYPEREKLWSDPKRHAPPGLVKFDGKKGVISSFEIIEVPPLLYEDIGKSEVYLKRKALTVKPTFKTTAHHTFTNREGIEFEVKNPYMLAILETLEEEKSVEDATSHAFAYLAEMGPTLLGYDTQVFFEDNQFAENILILIYVSLVYSSEIYWLSEIKPSKSEIYGLSEIKSS